MGFFNPSTVEVADLHRKQQLLLGYLTAKASRLALYANTIVVPVGLIMLGIQIAGTPWSVLTIVLAVIGILVAILADGMTLSAAARIRKTNEAFAALDAKYGQIPEDEMTEATKKRKKLEEKRLGKSKRKNTVFLSFFILVSAGLGDIFWHWCLAGLHSDILAWTFSTIFALLVSGVMCASQLYKIDNDVLIRESIESVNFMAIALKKDADAKAVSILAKKYETEITELANNTNVIKAAISEHSETVYDQLLCGGQGRIPLRIQQEREAHEYAIQREKELTKQQLSLMSGEPLQPIKTHDTEPIKLHALDEIVPVQLHDLDEPVEPNRGTILKGTMQSEYGDQIEALYRQNPSIKAAEIARQTGCTYHTAKKWLERVKTIKPAN